MEADNELDKATQWNSPPSLSINPPDVAPALPGSCWGPISAIRDEAAVQGETGSARNVVSLPCSPAPSQGKLFLTQLSGAPAGQAHRLAVQELCHSWPPPPSTVSHTRASQNRSPSPLRSVAHPIPPSVCSVPGSLCRPLLQPRGSFPVLSPDAAASFLTWHICTARSLPSVAATWKPLRKVCVGRLGESDR